MSEVINTDNYGTRTFTFHDADGETYRVDIIVSFYSIAKQLAPKAIRNKSKRTKLCHGAIVVKAVKA